MMNLPISLLGGIWGILLLTHVYGLSSMQASYVTSLLFFGTIIGSPFFGWLSDKMQRRKRPMLIGCLLSLLFMLMLIYQSGLSLSALMVLFLLLGFTTSTQIISYPYIAESTQPMLTATSVSVASFVVMGGQGVFQPFFGYLMDIHAKAGTNAHILQQGISVYAAADFHFAMLIFPASFLVAFLSIFLLKETYCKSIVDKS